MRVSTYQFSGEDLAANVDRFREALRSAGLEDMKEGVLLIDRSTGKALTITCREDEAALARSRHAAESARRGATDAAGGAIEVSRGVRGRAEGAGRRRAGRINGGERSGRNRNETPEPRATPSGRGRHGADRAVRGGVEVLRDQRGAQHALEAHDLVAIRLEALAPRLSGAQLLPLVDEAAQLLLQRVGLVGRLVERMHG